MSDTIAQAFRTNAELGRTSAMSDPGTVNKGPSYKQGPRVFGEKLSADATRAFYEAGVKAAQQAFAPVKAAQPTAPKPQTAGQVGAQKANSSALSLSPPPLPAPPQAALSFKPPPLQMPPSPVTATQQTMAMRQGEAGAGKIAGFNLSLTRESHTRPGEIEPNSTEMNPGTNFEEATRGDKRMGAAFDALRTQRNHDVLNSGNEAAIGTVTT